MAKKIEAFIKDNKEINKCDKCGSLFVDVQMVIEEEVLDDVVKLTFVCGECGQDVGCGEIKKEVKKEKKCVGDRLSEALEWAGWEVQCQWNYLIEQMNVVSDEMMEVSRIIEEQKVEQEISLRLGDKESAFELNNDIFKLKDKLECLDSRYDVLMDMWEEMFFDLLQGGLV
ncbi:hypothetical protein [Candidatus Contubernalis alkaliaceticus]|uniref:hypothetical protein n=1 Tax=Candidatus Contubernalis alkaliaceticus TaxID=338645 RepID=UPI001F4BF633|nr:hypothetical protein [Candidatus Contubernalis alkalaceticus]UNC92725.1 hypothetical protein HUE98_11830 [Candidatus Contubernalis alkalaceticus]